MKHCILNLDKGRNYPAGQDRLKRSLEKNQYTGDYLFFTEESQVNSPVHQDIPYSFKVGAFRKAIELGYDVALWCDASIYSIKNIDPVIKYIEENEYMIYQDDHNCGVWTNDKMLDYFSVKRDDAFKIGMILSGYVGLNLKSKISLDFLDQWEESIEYFRGSWNNNNLSESNDSRCMGHRHDQSAASLIINKLGMKDTQEYAKKLFHYCKPDSIPDKDCIFMCQGM